MGFGVWGLGSGVWGLGFGLRGLGGKDFGKRYVSGFGKGFLEGVLEGLRNWGLGYSPAAASAGNAEENRAELQSPRISRL